MSTFMVILPNNLIPVKYLAEITYTPQEINYLPYIILHPWFNLPSIILPQLRAPLWPNTGVTQVIVNNTLEITILHCL